LAGWRGRWNAVIVIHWLAIVWRHSICWPAPRSTLGARLNPHAIAHEVAPGIATNVLRPGLVAARVRHLSAAILHEILALFTRDALRARLVAAPVDGAWLHLSAGRWRARLRRVARRACRL
jgi:hypothetical protein